jgi:hypothetical protein
LFNGRNERISPKWSGAVVSKTVFRNMTKNNVHIVKETHKPSKKSCSKGLKKYENRKNPVKKYYHNPRKNNSKLPNKKLHKKYKWKISRKNNWKPMVKKKKRSTILDKKKRKKIKL